MLRFDSRAASSASNPASPAFAGLCRRILAAAVDGKLATPALSLHQVSQ
jgi:hypothetical protein